MKSCFALSTAFITTCLICTSGCGGGTGRTPSVEIQFEEVGRIGGASLEETDVDSLFGFGLISAIEADSYGNLYILDVSFMQVRKFSPEGDEGLTIQLETGEGPGEMQRPFDLTVNDEGSIYVLSSVGRTVTVFDQNGQFDHAFDLRFRPTQIDFFRDRIYITSFWTQPDSILHQFDSFGNRIRSLLHRPENWQTVFQSGNFGKFAFKEDGGLVYSYPSPYHIVEIDSLGQLIAESMGQRALDEDVETTQGNVGTITIMPSRSHGLAVLPGGFVLNAVLEGEDDYLDVFSSNLEFLKRIPVSDFGLERIRFMTADGKGNVYFDISFDNPAIVKFSVSVSVDD